MHFPPLTSSIIKKKTDQREKKTTPRLLFLTLEKCRGCDCNPLTYLTRYSALSQHASGFFSNIHPEHAQLIRDFKAKLCRSVNEEDLPCLTTLEFVVRVTMTQRATTQEDSLDEVKFILRSFLFVLHRSPNFQRVINQFESSSEVIDTPEPLSSNANELQKYMLDIEYTQSHSTSTSTSTSTFTSTFTFTFARHSSELASLSAHHSQ